MSKETKSNLRVFLCHASGDKPAVRDLYKRLVANDVDAWLDQEKLLPGQDWRVEIPRAVRQSDVVVICLSNQSITKEGYVQKEIKFALDCAEEKPEGTIFLIPARLEECRLPEGLNHWQWVDLFNENGYSRLLASLRVRAEEIGVTKNIGIAGADADEELRRFKRQPIYKNESIKIEKSFTQTEEAKSRIWIKSIAEALVQRGWPEKQAGVAEFAMQEVLDNAFKHGIKPDDKTAEIRICTELHKDWVVCEVTDPGKGFSLKKTLATQNVQGERGLSNVNQLASSLRQINPNTIEVIIDQNPTIINLNTVEDIWILSMNGNFDNLSKGYHEKIERIAKSLPPRIKLVIDLTNTTYLCSSALRDLINLYSSVCKHHGELITVIRPESRVMNIIELGYSGLFPSVETRSEALAALQKIKKRKRPS